MHQVIVVTVRENDGYEVVRETSQADSRYHPYIRETVPPQTHVWARIRNGAEAAEEGEISRRIRWVFIIKCWNYWNWLCILYKASKYYVYNNILEHDFNTFILC